MTMGINNNRRRSLHSTSMIAALLLSVTWSFSGFGIASATKHGSTHAAFASVVETADAFILAAAPIDHAHFIATNAMSPENDPMTTPLAAASSTKNITVTETLEAIVEHQTLSTKPTFGLYNGRMKSATKTATSTYKNADAPIALSAMMLKATIATEDLFINTTPIPPIRLLVKRATQGVVIKSKADTTKHVHTTRLQPTTTDKATILYKAIVLGLKSVFETTSKLASSGRKAGSVGIPSPVLANKRKPPTAATRKMPFGHSIFLPKPKNNSAEEIRLRKARFTIFRFLKWSVVLWLVAFVCSRLFNLSDDDARVCRNIPLLWVVIFAYGCLDTPWLFLLYGVTIRTLLKEVGVSMVLGFLVACEAILDKALSARAIFLRLLTNFSNLDGRATRQLDGTQQPR
jgi:hypothetical protein